MAAVLSVMFMGIGPPGAHFHSDGLVFLFLVKMALSGTFPAVWQSLREYMSIFTHSVAPYLPSNGKISISQMSTVRCYKLNEDIHCLE